MKKILGLDLGTNSIGWALVNEAENERETSSIIKLGVRVNPLTVDEQNNFQQGKSITTNADRTSKRSARRSLQRYKLRRENLIESLKENNIITENTILSETNNFSTFQTYKLRAKAAEERIELEEFARVLLMINKKRGYKSSRKLKGQDEGELVDGMDVAKELYNKEITPGEYMLELLNKGKKNKPEFYTSDLKQEFQKIWEAQKIYYPEILTDEFQIQLNGKSKTNTSRIFLAKYGIYTAENKGKDRRLESYQWRVKALIEKVEKDVLAFIISDLNGIINNTSGYLGAISDRSKELYFNKLTVGQYLMRELNNNPHFSLKNKVFYRQDYLDEFEKIWETQKEFHSQLTNELKKEIRDIVIFYQRRLKSQKGLISYCEFENDKIEVEIEGKKKTITIGSKVCPKSSPLFQEFKIWQILNNINVIDENKNSRALEQEEKEILFKELTFKNKLSKSEALKLLFENHTKLDLNYKEIEGNRTINNFYNAFSQIVEMSGHGEYDFNKLDSGQIIDLVNSVYKTLGIREDILFFDSSLEGSDFENQPIMRLWHLLYSFEGDNSKTGIDKLLNILYKEYGFEKDYAKVIANISFQDDYSSLSSKAIKKILPHLKEGNGYDTACLLAGYRHSKSSLTTEELENKQLKDKLELLPKNSLRNPVVEKILNQMVNVVNQVIDTYGNPTEIRIELARDLKNNAEERKNMTEAISRSTKEHEEYRDIIKKEFGFSNVSRNDIIRYKLYLELKDNGFKTLYSNTYIPREKIFDKNFDIEHIIPKAKLFDDSFSNKTLELRTANIEKSEMTAYDYVKNKYTEEGLKDYLNRIDLLYKSKAISKTKYNKLKMQASEIPSDFIDRDLRDSQYIAKKARQILLEISKEVVSTSGQITDRLRKDWQLVDIMKELNWDKYDKLGMTEIVENKDSERIYRIKDWTKRNDHRHHAMDALTIAFTKHNYINYLNNLNARADKSSNAYAIEQKELYRDSHGNLKFIPPMPLNDFRVQAKQHLEDILVSIKAKNKVVTRNINTTKQKGGTNKKLQLTPRGQLHLETIYGELKQYVTKEEKIGSSFNEEKINMVAKKSYREALLKRLRDNDNDAKKAFTGKNSLDKNPLFIDELQTQKVPEKVKLVEFETQYTIRKDITPDIKIDKVIDVGIRKKLKDRLKQYDNKSKEAFSNLEENPIWLNEEKGIQIKRVKISGVSNAVSLRSKKDHFGNLILDKEGNPQKVDFVNTGNNHHVAIYKDEKGNLQENVISFFEATARANADIPIIDKSFNLDKGWQFLFTMKQNEYFVFPNEKTGFNPKEIDLFNPINYSLISPNLFRVQKLSTKDYSFRHHLETSVIENSQLKGITWLRLGLSGIKDIVKVRVNHIGQIVGVGEY
ncbi:MAG: hypothetical protein H6Q16_1070 [Bacteroidetes bacterium]|nr:hypothetical protein [Bacteroidota bacterium]